MLGNRWPQKPPPGAAALDPSAALSQGLVSLWLLNGGTGPPYDLAAGWPAASLNGTTWAGSPYGPALAFNGTSNYLGLGAAPQLGAAGPMTVAAYAAPATGVLQVMIDTRNVPTSNDGWWLGVDSSGNNELDLVVMTSAGGSQTITSSSSIVDGKWHTWAASVSPSLSVALYRDGAAVGTGSLSSAIIASTTTNKAIGARADGASHYLSGGLGWLAVWNRALTAAEHAAIGTPTGIYQVLRPRGAAPEMVRRAAAGRPSIARRYTASGGGSPPTPGTASVVRTGWHSIAVVATAAAGGTGGLSYQWQYNWPRDGLGWRNAAGPGVTTLAATIEGLGPIGAYQVRLRVADGGGHTVYSNVLTTRTKHLPYIPRRRA